MLLTELFSKSVPLFVKLLITNLWVVLYLKPPEIFVEWLVFSDELIVRNERLLFERLWVFFSNDATPDSLLKSVGLLKIPLPPRWPPTRWVEEDRILIVCVMVLKIFWLNMLPTPITFSGAELRQMMGRRICLGLMIVSLLEGNLKVLFELPNPLFDLINARENIKLWLKLSVNKSEIEILIL